MSHYGGWEGVRQALATRIDPHAYDAWFRTLDATLEGGSLVVICPDRFSRDWIRSRYGTLIAEAAPHVERIEYTVAPDSSPRPAPRPLERRADTNEPENRFGRAARARRGGAHPIATGITSILSQTPRRDAAPREVSLPQDPSFTSFVVDPGNALALEAARAMARGSAGRCSPLVLSGASGLGKTHLCRAIRAEQPRGVLYLSSEEFTSEVTQAMRSGQMESVRQRYRRSTNVLILEDVQFLTGKRATQIELFHTLDHLLTRGKGIVLSADRTPHEIPGLDDRLRSRMTSGLVACIAPPELETRRSILREKASGGGIRIPEECLEILARRPVESTRDLLAGLNQVVARASLLRQPVTRELVSAALGSLDVAPRARSLEEIIELVSRASGVTVDDLRGPSKRRRFTRPRQLAMYLCRRYTDASLHDIGRALTRDHTSVIYAIDAVDKRIVEQPQLRYELEALAARLSAAPSPRDVSPSARGLRSAGGSTRGTRPT